MALGFPAITDPRENDWRALQGAIRNIRERITQAEGMLSTAQAQANQNTSSITTLKALNQSLAQLSARVTALEALARGNSTVTLVAGADIALDDPVVMISQTTCAPVDVSNPERIYAVVGVATAAATSGSNVVVQVTGARNLSYGNFTAGRALYADLEGLTEAPAYGSVAIPVGVATGAQSMWIQTSYPRLQYPSVYDASEQYLPVTWSLTRDAVTLTWDFNASSDGLVLKSGQNNVTTIPGVATGNALISGGVGVAPSYGKIGLTTHVSGVLSAANGGTGIANNAASTITISGAFASTFTMTGTTTVTFPTSGTLATTAQLPVGANPSASVGLTAVNGVATTFMRSDGAPALDQGIAPTWSGSHIFRQPLLAYVNTGTPPSALSGTVIHASGADGAGCRVSLEGYGNACIYGGRTSGGTLASPSATTGGLIMCSFLGYGHNGSAFTGSAAGGLILRAEATWTTTSTPTNLTLSTVPTGSTTRTDRVKLTDVGNFQVLNDNNEIQIGAGQDLRLYHNGTDSVVENDTGNLVIKVGGELDLEEVSTTTTAPAAGGGGALPATPSEYVTVIVNGNTRKFAVY